MSMPDNAELLKSSITTAARVRAEFPEVTFEELALDVCVRTLSAFRFKWYKF